MSKPNQSNTRDRKKPSQREQTFFFFNALVFFFAQLYCISLLDKESMLRQHPAFGNAVFFFTVILKIFNLNSSCFADNKTALLIYQSMSIMEAVSCLRFIERTEEEDFLEFVKDKGCW